jgi:hypothetical protein
MITTELTIIKDKEYSNGFYLMVNPIKSLSGVTISGETIILKNVAGLIPIKFKIIHTKNTTAKKLTGFI